MHKPELLAPAGNKEKLQTALNYGADAVYLGGQQFSLRAQAANFDSDELAQAIKLTHSMGKKLYLTVNIYAHRQDMELLPEYLKQAAELAPDAFIISDLGVLALARKYAPQIPLHISTQANTLNWQAAEVWRSLGARRVILGRELSLDEIAALTANTKLEMEIFVHGALCVAYSGRCLLSAYLTGRDANRGDCVQSCRWEYSLVEKSRPNEHLPIEEDAHGTYILNSKDLCLLPLLPQIMKSGVSSLKIEGRNKSAYYVANAVRIYRQAIDAAALGDDFEMRAGWMEELGKIRHRTYTTGFAAQTPDFEMQRYESADSVRSYDFVATLEELLPDCLCFQQRNHIQIGDTIEILLPDGRNLNHTVSLLIDADGQQIAAANKPKQYFYIPTDRQMQGQLAGLPLPLIVRRRAR